jgi:transcriptional regulator of arginine metabolism
VTKHERQSRLLALIESREISTQEDLVAGLLATGLQVTQATVSRDVKELGIIKVTSSSGAQKYVPMDRTGEVSAGRLMKVFAETAVSCDSALNTIVVRTLPGMAQACASAIDSMRIPELLGSIAGDDTVLIIARTESLATTLRERILRMIGHGGEEGL